MPRRIALSSIVIVLNCSRDTVDDPGVICIHQQGRAAMVRRLRSLFAERGFRQARRHRLAAVQSRRPARRGVSAAARTARRRSAPRLRGDSTADGTRRLHVERRRHRGRHRVRHARRRPRHQLAGLLQHRARAGAGARDRTRPNDLPAPAKLGAAHRRIHAAGISRPLLRQGAEPAPAGDRGLRRGVGALRPPRHAERFRSPPPGWPHRTRRSRTASARR